MNKYIISSCLLYLLFACTPWINAREDVSIIPRCNLLEAHEGFYHLQSPVRIIIVGDDFLENQLKADADRFATFLRNGKGLEVAVGEEAKAGNSEIVLKIEEGLFQHGDKGAYHLSVGPQGIHITGVDTQGVFYGLQSLKQMLPPAIFYQDYEAHPDALPDFKVGFIKIKDAPRFAWRGFMLDSCRHIQPVEKIKQYIDLMALYKMNIFHWHLTEDEAWRAEVKKYPKLTTIGGYPGDRSKDEELNGFYTQEQMREIVSYANEHYIKVVPEFDIPGHVNALLMAYPEYGCNEGPPLKMGKFGMRSFSSDAGRRAICAGKHEATMPFIHDVFTEFKTIFTDGLFHIGGDERPRGNWEKCTHCIALMKQMNFKDEHYMQNWLLNEVSQRLGERGIRTVAWAEHLQGGVPERQIVQAWHKASHVTQAIRTGREVINSYNRKIYLDYPANKTNAEELEMHSRRYRNRLVSTKSIYSFNPIPKGLTPEEEDRIIGLEAPVWTEQIQLNRLDKKVFPRLLSVAETGWTSPKVKNWESFQRRFVKHSQILEALNIDYDRNDSIIETSEQ